MKILAIRGKNLASLGEPFELDFQAQPLSHAGLFAITGPTGSGKTSILDAMCLALFDKVPRYKSLGKMKDSSRDLEGLNDKDARNMLRRDAVEAFAETDFIGIDRIAYRARWYVRRARRRIDGKIQASEQSLVRIDSGQALGDHRKSETARVVVDKLGLDFAQFCRSVLLAQGDFAAFLKAGEKDRAELLEKMTGAEIYSKLSKATHQRWKDAKDAVNLLADRLEAVALLDEETRMKLRDEEKAAAANLADHLGAIETLKAAEAWYEQLENLQAESAAAETERGAATAAHDALTDLRCEADAVARTEPIRPILEAYRQVAAHCRELDQHWTLARNRLEKAKAASRHAEEKVVSANSAEADAEKAWHKAQPELLEARRLDVSLQERSRVAEAASQALTKHRDDVTKLERALQPTRAELSVLKKRIAEIGDWFDQRPATGRLITQWPATERDFRELAALKARLRDDAETIERLEARAKSAEKKYRDRQSQIDNLETALIEATADQSRTESERNAFNATELTQSRETNARARAAIAQLMNAEKEATARENVVIELERTIATIDQAISTAEKAADLAEKSRLTLHGSLQESERYLARTRARQQFEGRRHELLETGEPCPLCGSPDHPLAGETRTGVDTELLAAEQRTRDLKAQVELAAGERVRQETIAKSQKAALDERQQERSQASTASKAALAHRHSCLMEWADAGGDVNTPTAQWPDLQNRLEKEAESLAQQAEAMARLEQILNETRARREALRQEKEALTGALSGLLKDSVSGQEALKAHKNAAQERRERFQELLEANRAFQDRSISSADLETSPNRFLKDAVAAVESWRQHQEEATHNQEAITELRDHLQSEESQLHMLTEQTPLLEQTAAKAQQETQDIANQRALIFQGVDAATVESSLRQAQQSAAAAMREAVTARQATAEEHSAAVEACQNAGNRLLLERLSYLGARTKWFASLLNLNLTEREAESLFAKQGKWLHHARQTIETATERCKVAQTVWEERANRLKNHQQKDRPESTREHIRESFTEAEKTRLELEKQVEDLRLRLRQDDAERQKHAEWLPQLQTLQAEEGRWHEMDKLIGSSDGTKFRAYAQSLTLQVLIDLANEQLDDLEPRYRLHRQAHTDLALVVVDRYMGDEIRNINSLSGGESFLVSLALALALSTLTAGHTPIESLFIDEGFGTLDARTLDTALAALEAIQASGRTVGIISHVGAIIERISVRVEVRQSGSGGSTVHITEN